MIKPLLLMLVILPAFTAFADSPTLKSSFPDFKIGAAIPGPASFTPDEITLLTSQFNALTPENCMKPQPTHPEEKTWHFDQADALVDFAQKNNMQVFGHTLVWHNQCPDWFFKDGDKPASRELALARLKEHITTLVARYKGKIRSWDVVNEAISDKPDEYLRKTPWLDIVGEDYIEQAFRFAHEADPNLELQYNDYNIEMPGKRKKALRLLHALLDKGIPVASVGIQAHYSLDHVPFKELEDAINEFRKLNGGKLKVAITELDLDVMPRKTECADATAQEAANLEMQKPKPCPPEVLKRQADQYARLLTLFKKHKNDLVRVTFWGLDDAHTWLNGWPLKRYNHPLLWDRNAQPKPALQAVLNAS
jgi:endo-1,4-beta-xylanase